ncbi:hypothetical protein GCM10018980_37050 [Streptomyces capoamus]|uniref:Uncharacterized protein n=1 Tax=Streptomyces capoamus TaxID=68183 RepID=A0A919C7Q1_9ACTN|nr:hypothetical protein GCM10010501_65710 [Streptomyces libani subsp. rufus]GHG53225.1 hypothetical protein GCM10018980_37050 [Streptomyces capoamus]
MVREFPPPPRAETVSELIRKRLEEVRNAGGTRETVTVDWNGQQIHVDVIDLPLNDLYLNPGTHRIRAQRSHRPDQDRNLDKDPFGEAGQDYLRSLLQAKPSDPDLRDPDFDKLKEDLDKFGQNEPGLVTHHGVLVNGNTRAVALRELGKQSMRVGVLPSSFTQADIDAVELALQLRQDQRRDYSYINRLIAMEEQAAMGRTPEQIAKEFRVRTATYHQERWILSTIKELNDRSASGGGVALRLVDWEGAQERLKELQRLHAKLGTLDPDQAEIVKERRLAAILLNFSKTDLRHIDETFLKERYLEQVLPPELADSGTVAQPESVSIPGLDLEVPATTSAVSAARALNDRILRAAATVRDASGGLPDSEKASAQALLDQAKDAFDRAIENAGRDARLRKRKQLAPARLADACVNIDQCVIELVQARTSNSLDEEAFDEAVLKLRGSLRKLAQQAGRGIPNPGDGVSWLLAAATVEGTQ